MAFSDVMLEVCRNRVPGSAYLSNLVARMNAPESKQPVTASTIFHSGD